mgnify:CR=1 FL=1
MKTLVCFGAVAGMLSTLLLLAGEQSVWLWLSVAGCVLMVSGLICEKQDKGK